MPLSIDNLVENLGHEAEGLAMDADTIADEVRSALQYTETFLRGEFQHTARRMIEGALSDIRTEIETEVRNSQPDTALAAKHALWTFLLLRGHTNTELFNRDLAQANLDDVENALLQAITPEPDTVEELVQFS